MYREPEIISQVSAAYCCGVYACCYSSESCEAEGAQRTSLIKHTSLAFEKNLERSSLSDASFEYRLQSWNLGHS